WFQRFRALLEREVLSLLVGPELCRKYAIGAEDHDKPLLAALRTSEREARQVANERQRRCPETHRPQELSSAGVMNHVVSPLALLVKAAYASVPRGTPGAIVPHRRSAARTQSQSLQKGGGDQTHSPRTLSATQASDQDQTLESAV